MTNTQCAHIRGGISDAFAGCPQCQKAEIERLTGVVGKVHQLLDENARVRAALQGAVEWASPMAEAPIDSRPIWFDVARSALAGSPNEPSEPPCSHSGRYSEWETDTMTGKLCHICGQNFDSVTKPLPWRTSGSS